VRPYGKKIKKMCFKLFLEKSAYSEKMENKNWQNFCFFFCKKWQNFVENKKKLMQNC
jgi:hypothetical protein